MVLPVVSLFSCISNVCVLVSGVYIDFLYVSLIFEVFSWWISMCFLVLSTFVLIYAANKNYIKPCGLEHLGVRGTIHVGAEKNNVRIRDQDS